MRLEFVDEGDYWQVWNNNSELLGNIQYHEEWKEFVWEQYQDMIMSEDCLDQVLKFMKKENKKREKK